MFTDNAFASRAVTLLGPGLLRGAILLFALLTLEGCKAEPAQPASENRKTESRTEAARKTGEIDASSPTKSQPGPTIVPGADDDQTHQQVRALQARGFKKVVTFPKTSPKRWNHGCQSSDEVCIPFEALSSTKQLAYGVLASNSGAWEVRTHPLPSISAAPTPARQPQVGIAISGEIWRVPDVLGYSRDQDLKDDVRVRVMIRNTSRTSIEFSEVALKFITNLKTGEGPTVSARNGPEKNYEIRPRAQLRFVFRPDIHAHVSTDFFEMGGILVALLDRRGIVAGPWVANVGLRPILTSGGAPESDYEVPSDPSTPLQFAPHHAGLLRHACEGGDMGACKRLGICYLDGDCGFAKDEKRAGGLFQKACDGGNAAGCAGLGVCYESGDCGFAKDEKRAGRLFQDSCTAGGMLGCNGLGDCYRLGGCGLARDEKRAGVLYQKACDGGDMGSCNSLGNCYRFGQCGLSKEAERAGDLYQKACNGGEMVGCALLGACYEDGDCGLAKEAKRAGDLYQKACKGGWRLGCDDMRRLRTLR